VEAQVEEANGKQSSAEKPPLTDAEKTKRRERDNLRLSHAYVRHQIESSTNERYTETLRKALSEIEQKLQQLEAGRA
jgi:hypothetical protein